MKHVADDSRASNMDESVMLNISTKSILCVKVHIFEIDEIEITANGWKQTKIFMWY